MAHKKTKVVVVDGLKNADRNLDIEIDVLGPNVDIVRYACSGDEQCLLTACRDADAILTAYAPLSRTVIDQLQSCQLISVAATGYSCVDIEAAAGAGISVCAIDDYCTDEVADHTILLMLALSRRLLEYHEQIQADKRWQFDALSGLRRMQDMTLGIVGFGHIGQAVARRAIRLGMAMLAYDPHGDAGAASRLGVHLCDLPELLAESDIISLHCSLSPKNERLIDERAFQQMSKHPILINCARGGLIDEHALVAALDKGQISGAGLDVLTNESPNLSESPLIGRSNVILTPHVAFYSDVSIIENRRVSASNIRHFLDGEHARVRKYIHLATE